MKNVTYNNINSIFSFENICLELNKFLIKENLLYKSKIWITITVYNKQNKSFILLNNLPFYIKDYTDIIIVLKKVFETKSFFNRKDKINKIVFSYYLENKFTWKEYSVNILILILYSVFLLLSTFIIFYATNLLLNLFICTENINNNLEIINQSTMSLDIAKENSNNNYNNKCIFSIFSRFFVKSCSSPYIYYPSNFLETNFKMTHLDNNISSVDYIISKQFIILDKTIQEFTKYFNDKELLIYDLNAWATEFSYYKQYCLP